METSLIPRSEPHPNKKCDWQTLARCSSPGARAVLPASLAEELGVLPLTVLTDQHGWKGLLVAVSDEATPELLQKLRFVSDHEILPEAVPSRALRSAINAAYRGSSESLYSAVEVAAACLPSRSARRVCSEQKSEKIEGPIPDVLRTILCRAHAVQSTDIHLEPMMHGSRLRLRVDGALRLEESFQPTNEVYNALVRHIKILCALDPTGVPRPQEGGFTYSEGGLSLRLRVSFVPQLAGEKVVIRMLDNNFLSAAIDGSKGGTAFRMLGMNRNQEQILSGFLANCSGSIIVVGPTGSGKSTLLYAALNSLNNGRRNIVTLEDPVERILPGINQVEIQKDRGLDYEHLFNKLLRQDPDVVLVGEIREKSTAETALAAGLTGHLVLSTLHATDCIEALSRLLQLGVRIDVLAASLRLIVSQRLIPLLCTSCIEDEQCSRAIVRAFHLPDSFLARTADGCEMCGFTGVRGRIGAFEMLPITPAVRELIGNPSTGSVRAELTRIATEEGYQSYAYGVRELLMAQRISPRAACETLGIPYDQIHVADATGM